MNKERLGSFIGDCRRELGLTQRELAERLHVTDKAVSKWERGLSYPDVTLLEPLAAALGLGVEELMPLLCELDKVMIGLQHGVLHREQTIASGGGCCDYFITGDREQLKPEDKN